MAKLRRGMNLKIISLIKTNQFDSLGSIYLLCIILFISDLIHPDIKCSNFVQTIQTQ